MLAVRVAIRWSCLLIFAAVASSAAGLRASPPTVSWAPDVSGSWSNAGNWSSNPALPAAGDNVVIDPPGATITVTHDQGSDSLASLLCNENLVLAGGALSVSASSQVTGSLTVAMGVLLAASGSAATLTANGAAIIDGSNLSASGGGQLNLPTATTYIYAGSAAFASPYLTASGANSDLNLSGVTTIAGSTGAFNTLTVSGLSGGYVDLHNLTGLTGFTGAFSQLTITASSGGYVDLRNLPNYTTGSVQVLADGAHSVVNLSGMTSFSASNATNGAASITARNGGTVLMGSLTALSLVNIVMDGTGTMATSQIVSYTNGTATIAALRRTSPA